MENVGIMLRTIRKKRKLSQRKLAAELKVSQREISYVEQGKRKHFYMIEKILQHYKLSENEIEELIWAQVTDFLNAIGLPPLIAEKMKAEHVLLRFYGRGSRVKKILSSFQGEVSNVLSV